MLVVASRYLVDETGMAKGRAQRKFRKMRIGHRLFARTEGRAGGFMVVEVFGDDLV